MAQTKTVPKRATMVTPTPNKKTLSSQKKIPVAKTPATPSKAPAKGKSAPKTSSKGLPQKKIPVAKTPATPTKAAAQSVPKKTPTKTPAKVSPKTAAKKPTPNSVPKPTYVNSKLDSLT